MTAHRAQGTTVDRTFVLGSEELYREWGYTALTRHRDEPHYYANLASSQMMLGMDEEADLESQQLTALERQRQKRLAIDLDLGS